jgi:hypothetical protein
MLHAETFPCERRMQLEHMVFFLTSMVLCCLVHLDRSYQVFAQVFVVFINMMQMTLQAVQ